jgi:hypothetical protein
VLIGACLANPAKHLYFKKIANRNFIDTGVRPAHARRIGHVELSGMKCYLPFTAAPMAVLF